MSENENTPATTSGIATFIKAMSKGVAGRIAIGMLCTALVGAIKDAPAIWHAFRFLCAGIGKIGDREASRKIDILLDKGREIGSDAPPLVTASLPVESDTPSPSDTSHPAPGRSRPTLQGKLAAKLEQGKAVAAEGTKKLQDKADETKGELTAKADEAIGKLDNRLQGGVAQGGTPPGGQFGGSVNFPQPLPGGGMAGLPPSQPGGVGGAIDRGLNRFDKSWEAKRIAREKRLAELEALRPEYANFWAEHGPNGYCVACRQIMTVSREGKGATRCRDPRCGNRTTANKVRAMGTPAMPEEPPPAFYAWKAKRDAAEAAKVKP